uniref:PBPb domain-containing protein n=1 Tax=Rodentolepis nana TaxID=102285 RepID=A0A0R3T6X6_RODNA
LIPGSGRASKALILCHVDSAFFSTNRLMSQPRLNRIVIWSKAESNTSTISSNWLVQQASTSNTGAQFPLLIGWGDIFTEYTTDARRNSQIFASLLKRPEYTNLKASKISPIFLNPPTIPATASELENLYRNIKNTSIYVQIGPDNYYGPSFFPKQTETNNPRITRKSFIGFDLSLTIQHSVIEVAIAHLVANLDVIRLAYILETIGEFDLFDGNCLQPVTVPEELARSFQRRTETPFTRQILLDEEIFGFLSGTIGHFRVYYVADFENPEELLNAILVDDANVFVVKAKQESTLKILQTAQTKNILQHPFSWLTFNGAVTLAENDLNVQNANFIAIELSPNGNLFDYPEFTEIPKPITSVDLIFRDTAVFALSTLAEQLNKPIENVSYITTTIEGVNKETIKQTWNFYSYVNAQYNIESSYKVTVSENGSVSATFQNLKSPPTTQEVLEMMQSRTLRLGTIVAPPLVTTELDTRGKLVPKGPEIAVAMEIMRRLNLSYEITIFDSPMNVRSGDGLSGLFKHLSQSVSWLQFEFLIEPTSRVLIKLEIPTV